MRKFLEVLRSSNGAMFLSIICASIGSAMFIPGIGLVTTLPFVVLFTAIPTIISKKYYMPVFFFAVSYFFCFAKDTPLKYPDVWGGYTLHVALWALIISAITCVACYFTEKALKNKSKRIPFGAIAIFLFAAGIFCTSFINGTPWESANAKSQISAYCDTRFTSDKLDIGGVYYNAEGKYYACDAKIKNTTDRGSFIFRDDVTNTLDTHAVNLAGDDKATEIQCCCVRLFQTTALPLPPTNEALKKSRFLLMTRQTFSPSLTTPLQYTAKRLQNPL